MLKHFRINKNLWRMRLIVYSLTLHQKRMDKWERSRYLRPARYCCIVQRVIFQLLRNVLISAREGRYTCSGRATYPRVPDEAWINIHQASYVISVCLILFLILASSVLCVGVRFQSTTSTKLSWFRKNVSYMTQILPRWTYHYHAGYYS